MSPALTRNEFTTKRITNSGRQICLKYLSTSVWVLIPRHETEKRRPRFNVQSKQSHEPVRQGRYKCSLVYISG
jgi:hypothetical protein